MAVHRLSREQARRIAIRAQLLDADRPTDLIEMIKQLTFLQLDPTAAIAPNADLVAWSRLGAGYRPADLTSALQDRRLVEIEARIRAMDDIGVHLAESAEWAQSGRYRRWVEDNTTFRRDILRRLKSSGPLVSRDIPDTSTVAWGSTGWTNNRNVTQMLQWLTATGEIAIAGRRGKQRLFDLAERVYPSDLTLPPGAVAYKINNDRRLRSLGIARATGTALPFEPVTVGDSGEPAVVDGINGDWRVDPEQLTALRDTEFGGRTALLSPFDRLIYDRVRAQQLWDFEFTLEMYKPKSKRRWGYYALPIVHGDQLVGKLDATADRKAGAFRIHAIHPDVRFTRAIDRAVQAEIADLAGWLDLSDLIDER
ncbi:DNA glycosylase AlkZ-like family protein [Microlunatus soli]|uniref:Uncharacterized conserved protein YcaQ, contains winged helix DNA-binding domain n=1 Tax=Microlunatus soli TaxID=630515 RepID=A0A1H1UUC4_9ACTN|nr:crosslink repair DNA glycosylase YcaQ family protein [Microlunatus soli]SDS76075.1 Uncharacterized conserved protein YcaQ, contains winged helix DNA-binding domain [Microlunatus soli]